MQNPRQVTLDLPTGAWQVVLYSPHQGKHLQLGESDNVIEAQGEETTITIPQHEKPVVLHLRRQHQ
jgi:hypothetical protein